MVWWGRRRQKIDDARGFTLIETLVALTVILAVLTGPVALITRGIIDFSFSKNKIIAINLAQEGVELVRLIRENNVICDTLNGPTKTKNWDDNPSPGPSLGSGGAQYALDVTQTEIIGCAPTGNPMDVPITTLKTNIGSCDITHLKLDAGGVYNYITGNDTPFVRCVRVCVPPEAGGQCGTSNDPGSALFPIPADDQMEIVSTVEWQERGVSGNSFQCPILGSRCVTLRDRLYNWR